MVRIDDVHSLVRITARLFRAQFSRRDVVYYQASSVKVSIFRDHDGALRNTRAGRRRLHHHLCHHFLAIAPNLPTDIPYAIRPPAINGFRGMLVGRPSIF